MVGAPQVLKCLITGLIETSDVADLETLRAVKIHGKNMGNDGKVYTILNEKVFFDEDGNLMQKEDFEEASGLTYISHLVPPGLLIPGTKIADLSQKCSFEGPFKERVFEAPIRFLKGTLPREISNHDHGTSCWCSTAKEMFPTDVVLEKLDTKNISGEKMAEDNFLSQCFVMALGYYMANYDEVKLLYTVFFNLISIIPLTGSDE